MAQMQQVRVMRAAALLMATMTISRILGLVRDMIMYPMFGRNYITDAYTAAFTIPDTLYTILIGGALSAAFIPVFSSYLAKDDQPNAWKVSSLVISWGLLLMGVSVIAAYIFTPQLMAFLVPEFNATTQTLTVTLTRIMLLQPVFMMLAGISMGILHSHQHFLWPAIGSMLYNLFIVTFGALLAGPIEARFPGYGIAGFSLGVVSGAAAFFLVQLPALRKADFHFQLAFDIHHPGFKRLIQLMIPIIIGLSVKQINLIVNQMLASGLEQGAVAALRMAQKFMNVPIYVFASSIVVAIYPTMTRQAALHDMPEFKKSLSLGIRVVSFICIPSAIGLSVLREPILRLFLEFQSGAFNASDTVITGQVLLFYCIGLTFYAIVDVLLRGFYALQNTVTPVIVSVISIAINLFFSVVLVKSFALIGLPLAYSIAGIAQCIILFILLRMRIGQMDLRHILISCGKTLSVSLLMGLTAWGAVKVIAAVLDVSVSKTAQGLQLCAAMGAAVLVFFALAYILRMEEAQLVINVFKRRLRRKKHGQAAH